MPKTVNCPEHGDTQASCLRCHEEGMAYCGRVERVQAKTVIRLADTETQLSAVQAELKREQQVNQVEGHLRRKAHEQTRDAREAARTILAELKDSRPEWLERWPWLARMAEDPK